MQKLSDLISEKKNPSTSPVSVVTSAHELNTVTVMCTQHRLFWSQASPNLG